jgi:hypothetical protein
MFLHERATFTGLEQAVSQHSDSGSAKANIDLVA